MEQNLFVYRRFLELLKQGYTRLDVMEQALDEWDLYLDQKIRNGQILNASGGQNNE